MMPASSLAAFQRQFLGALVAADMAPLAAAVQQPAGLAVYAHARRAALVDALADNFAHALQWLGGDAFAELALAYVAITPSASWTLADYGSDFAQFLQQQMPDDAEVAELAAIDWALARAFAAADPPAADWALRPDLAWDSLQLVLAPGAVLLPLATNADAIWAAIPDTIVAPVASPGIVLVWREGLEPRFRRLPEGEAALLAALAGGQAFGPACEACGADAECIGRWLRCWLSARLVAPRA
jgi:hypothetical protein